MTCLEARRLAPRFLAMELPAEAERDLREHLATCQECRDAISEREPALALAWTLSAEPRPEDESFVGEVLAGVHQRALERRLHGRRSRLAAAAAAVLVTLFGGTAVVRQLTRPAAQVTAVAPLPRPAAAEPAFIEVNQPGVRLYQLTPASDSRQAIQVAFIVDPHLEL